MFLHLCSLRCVSASLSGRGGDLPFVNGRWLPLDPSSCVELSLGGQCHFKISISTSLERERERKAKRELSSQSSSNLHACVCGAPSGREGLIRSHAFWGNKGLCVYLRLASSSLLPGKINFKGNRKWNPPPFKNEVLNTFCHARALCMCVPL